MPQQAGICRTIFVFKPRWVLYNILINTAGHAVREKRADRAGGASCPSPKTRRNYGASVILLWFLVYGSDLFHKYAGGLQKQQKNPERFEESLGDKEQMADQFRAGAPEAFKRERRDT